jgi:hypothetical protein
MKRLLFACAVLGPLGCAVPARPAAPAPVNAVEPDWAVVRVELGQRVEEDQRLRNRLMNGGGHDMQLLHELEACDQENTAWIADLVEHHGWPSWSRVGQEGAQQAWLLVQHADQNVEFQERCLELLRRSVADNDASPKHLAYLEDRVAMHRGRPQRYGTQFVSGANGYEPYTLEDPARVDEWRQAVGLGSLAEYSAQLRGE